MSTFLKDNWFKLSFLIIIIIVAGIVFYWFEIKTTNENDMLNQQKCATQAQKTLDNFESINPTAPPTATYASDSNFNQTNHYNQKLNKCFILITYYLVPGGGSGISPDKFSTGESFFDAYENNNLGGCIHYSLGKDTCLIGGIQGTTISYDKWKEFVNQKMESNQFSGGTTHSFY